MASGPVETKVQVATLASTITAGVVSWIMLTMDLPAAMNEPIAGLVLGVVTGALTFVFSWLARHTNRVDVDSKS